MPLGNQRGGHRPRAGTKPGTDKAGRLPMALRRPRSPAAQLRAAPGVLRWLDAHPDLLEIEIDRILDARSVWVRMADDVLTAYDHIIHSPSHPAHGQIIRDAADRIWHKPVIAGPDTGTPPPSITIISHQINVTGDIDARSVVAATPSTETPPAPLAVTTPSDKGHPSIRLGSGSDPGGAF